MTKGLSQLLHSSKAVTVGTFCLYIVAILGISVPAPSSFAQTITNETKQEGLLHVDPKSLAVPETLSDLGVSIQLDKPEGAILAFSLPDVYILPGSRLYWFVKVWESLQLVLAETPEEKSDLLFYFAEVRLSETVQLLKNDKTSNALSNLDRYKGQLSQAIGTMQEIDDETIREQRYNRLDEQVWYQKALSHVIQAEGISDIIDDISFALIDQQVEKGGVTLEDAN